jgi:hypothetical protein
MADQRDEGDESDFDARIAEIAAAAQRLALPGDDYARHVRAELRWQGRRAALRLWERVKRCIALGQ